MRNTTADGQDTGTRRCDRAVMKPHRNDRCPCGSGKKFKRCCGAVMTAKTTPTFPQAIDQIVRSPRHCGPCTACCDGWLKGNILGHEVYPGKPCPYSTGHSCSIYEQRPQHPCRKFICGWLEANSPLPEEFRPDKLGVIFVIAEWRGAPIYILAPAGRDPTPQLLEWVTRLSLRARRPFLYQARGEWYGVGPPEFQNEMLAKLARGEELW